MLAASSNKLRRGVTSGEDGMPLVESGMVPSGSMCRTTSCVDDPQGTALEALKHPDMRLLADLLSEEGAVDANKQYATDSFKTLLHIALDLENTQAVKILLSGGAKADHFNTTLKLTAIHVAAMKGNHEALSFLVRSGGPKSLDVKDRSGRTALHLAALGCGKENEEKYLKCVKVLIERGAGLNITDNKGGQTPLYIAAAGGCFDAVKLLMDSGADASIPCQGVSTKQLIKDKFNKEQVEKLDIDNPSIISGDMLRQTLFNMVDKAELDGPDDIKWRSMLAKAKPYDLNVDNGKMTLTQLCAERGLHTYLDQLLRNGADPNIYTLYRSSPPILLAAAAGHAQVLQVLVEHNQTNMNNNASLKIDFTVLDDEFKQTILHQIIRKPRLNLGLSENSKAIDYESCLNIILDSKQTNLAGIINKQDILGNTPLHYATQFWDQETVTKLLLLGANIGLRNYLGEAPISNILPDTMESFLDNHCLKSEGNPTNEDFKITFHYDFLAPPRENDGKLIQIQDSEQGGGKEDKTPQPETDVLWYMARSKDHRHLLKHPVITSFLALKWSRISSHYNSNMLFFTILVGTLTAYIFSNYAGFSLGVIPPTCPSNITDNLTMPAQPYGNSHSLWWMLTVLLGLLLCRELLQFSISPGQHFNSVENIVEVLLIVLTGVLIFYGHPGCDMGFKRELSTAVLLFSWILFVTMVGRHPRLSSYNIYSTMFYRVLKTFISFLTWYSLFIIAFALCFYILLHKDNGQENDYPFFDNLGFTLVKTFSMFVGELEFSDIPFNSPFSYFFFLAFVFLIVVVLMNLLNGLAVSDTGLIREEAEIHAHVSRVEVISQAEATLLGDPAHLLRGHGWISKLVPSCGLRRKLGSALRCQTFFRTITASNGILLFYSFLPNKRLVVYPNKDNLVCSSWFSAKEVGRDILKSAKNLILKLNEEDKKSGNLENAVRSIEIRQQKLEKKLDEVLKGLESLTKAILN
eukprot:TRINITY_DN7041_c0_g1_i5.p1 TRINITY_DN7041_c0_g1~~TRINITY_DN7041_c0_g1_i5.p1  ORF type:complete len:976 (-),score=208.34 TRINITY_DN7041_c0_g1_i5:92-3019(-)